MNEQTVNGLRGVSLLSSRIPYVYDILKAVKEMRSERKSTSPNSIQLPFIADRIDKIDFTYL